MSATLLAYVNTDGPIREAGETAEAFMLRWKDYQAIVSDAFEPVHTFGANKTCDICNRVNGAATKKCPCGNKLLLSQTPAAKASVARRAKVKANQRAKSHDICGICQFPLAKGGRDLGVSMCTKEAIYPNGDVYYKLAPCGRAMHLKCLKSSYKKSLQRHSTFGLLPNKCAHCQMKTESPHFLELFLPRK